MRALTGCLVAALWACLAPVSGAQELTEQDKADRLQALRLQYPDAPPEALRDLASFRQTMTSSDSCRLVDWMATGPASIEPERAKAAVYKTAACTVPIGDLTPEVVETRLGDRTFALDPDPAAGVLTLYARSEAKTPKVCCSVQGELRRIGDGPLWAQRYRLRDLDRATLFLTLTSDTIKASSIRRWRGPSAGEAPVGAQFENAMVGQVVRTTLAVGPAAETREVSTYLPPGWSKDRAWPVVYLTDGATHAFANMVDAMIARGEIRPVLLVSVESGSNAVRMQEYFSSGEEFDRHLQFFATDLTAFATKEYGASTRREDRMIAGFSNGGVFALRAGVLRPDVFGTAAPMSPGPARLTLPAGAERARFHISGGLYEPGSLRGAQKAAETLKAAGYSVTERYPVAGHAQDQWQEVLRLALIDTFPPE